MSGSPSRRAAQPSAAGAVEQRSTLEPALRQAVAVGVDQPLRIGPVAGRGDEILRRGARARRSASPSSMAPMPMAPAAASPAPAGQRDARRQAELGGDGRAQRASRQRCLRRCAASAPRSGRWPPGSRATRRGRLVQPERARGVAGVGDVLAGELERAHSPWAAAPWAMRANTSGSCCASQSSLGAVKPGHGRHAGDAAEVGRRVPSAGGIRPGRGHRSTELPVATADRQRRGRRHRASGPRGRSPASHA